MLLAAQKNKKQLEKWTKLNYDKNIVSRNSLCRMSILRMPISGHAPRNSPPFASSFLCPASKTILYHISMLSWQAEQTEQSGTKNGTEYI
jgi:hypothetical protein